MCRAICAHVTTEIFREGVIPVRKYYLLQYKSEKGYIDDRSEALWVLLLGTGRHSWGGRGKPLTLNKFKHGNR